MTISQAVAINAPLRGCVFQLAPLVTIDQQGKVSGPVIDYFRRHIEPALGRTIEWQGLNVARLLSNLESGECDLTPLLSYSPERARHFRYIDPHLLLRRPVLVVLVPSRLHAVERQEDLYGTTIGWSSQAIVPPLLQHPQIHIDTLSQLSWEHGNMQKLLRRRIDAALFSNDISANHFRAKLPAATRLIYLGHPAAGAYCAEQVVGGWQSRTGATYASDGGAGAARLAGGANPAAVGALRGGCVQ